MALTTSLSSARPPAPTAAGGSPSPAWWRWVLPDAGLILTRAPLLVPVVLVAGVSVASIFATLPLVRIAYAARPEMLETAVIGLRLMAILSPVAALAKGAVFGAVAWAVLVLTGSALRLRALVSAVLYGQVILALQGAWIAGLLWLLGPSRIQAPGDLVMSLGLDAFVSDPASPLGALARNVTPFHLAWFVLLTAVLARGEGVGRGRGALATFAVWAVFTGLGVIRAAVV